MYVDLTIDPGLEVWKVLSPDEDWEYDDEEYEEPEFGMKIRTSLYKS